MKTALLFAAGLLLCTSGFSQNVGIGTTNPLFKLDVRNGSINVDSVYRIGTVTVLAVRGSGNLFVGKDAGTINTGGANTFSGGQAGYHNSTGGSNSFFGSSAGYSNTIGISNSFFGVSAGHFNTTGLDNSFFGRDAGFSNTDGSANSFFGQSAGSYNTTGNYNSFFGKSAGYIAPNNLSNFTAIGYNSGHNYSNSNTIEIGNNNITWIGGQVGWSTYSDARIKQDIKDDVPGLVFINSLRPVTYNLNIHQQNDLMYAGKQDNIDWPGKYDIEQQRMTGFIAQEVEQAALQSGYDFHGVTKPKNPDGLYSLTYSEFVVPLVKAVQEQQEQIDVLSSENKELRLGQQKLIIKNIDLERRIELVEQQNKKLAILLNK